MSPLASALLVLLHCLCLTVLLELGLAALLGVRSGLDFVNIFLAQVITNPLVVLLAVLASVYLTRAGCIASVVVLEVSAVIVEGLLYRRVLDYRRIPPLLFSLILNAFSFGAGQLLNLIW